MKRLKGKGVLAPPGDYIYFKSQVPLHKIPVGSKQWRYYDFGPKVVPPLICLPGTVGTADVHYKQIMALSMKGYRVISVDIPQVWSHHEWVQAFEKFLDAIDVHHIHIYGTALGGFLAQLFAQYRPRRVKSLVLSNTFLDTSHFSAAMPWAPVVSWTPSFLLKRYVLIGIRDGPHEPFIADSVDFVVSQVETLSRDDLASRLTLTADSASVAPLLLPDASITIMDTNDYCATPQTLKDEVGDRYPGARRAYMKSGGDFPFLSRPDEVNLHLQLHLRRVGLEPRSDLVPGAPRPIDVASTSDENSKVFIYQEPNGDEESSSRSEQRFMIDNVDIPLKDDNEIVGVPIEFDELEDDDDGLFKPDRESCKGPLGTYDQEDKNDPPEDDEGSPRPLKSGHTGNTEVRPGNDSAGTSGDSSTMNEREDSVDAPKDCEGSVLSIDIVNTEYGTSNQKPPTLSDAVKTNSEIQLRLLLSYLLYTYMNSLYIPSCNTDCFGPTILLV